MHGIVFIVLTVTIYFIKKIILGNLILYEKKLDQKILDIKNTISCQREELECCYDPVEREIEGKNTIIKKIKAIENEILKLQNPNYFIDC
jgi:hypothetical protein